MPNNIAIFKGNEIRKVMHEGEWWFVITDIISVLTNSKDPSQYYKKIKQRDKELAKIVDNKGGVQFAPPLRLSVNTKGGKQKLNCWNTQGV